MKYIITKFDGVSDYEDDNAGLLVVPDDVNADELMVGIEDTYMADQGETWETLDEYLEENYPTVSYEGFEGLVYI